MAGTQYKVRIMTRFVSVLTCSFVQITKGDLLLVNKVPHAEVGKEIIVDDILLLGSQNQTIVGRPTIDGYEVVLAVEEQTLDAKTIAFKKRRRTSRSKRTRGFRRPVTSFRVMDIRKAGETSSSASSEQTPPPPPPPTSATE
jgi:large subunit ribosomal protein L21